MEVEMYDDDVHTVEMEEIEETPIEEQIDEVCDKYEDELRLGI